MGVHAGSPPYTAPLSAEISPLECLVLSLECILVDERVGQLQQQVVIRMQGRLFIVPVQRL